MKPSHIAGLLCLLIGFTVFHDPCHAQEPQPQIVVFGYTENSQHLSTQSMISGQIVYLSWGYNSMGWTLGQPSEQHLAGCSGFGPFPRPPQYPMQTNYVDTFWPATGQGVSYSYALPGSYYNAGITTNAVNQPAFPAPWACASTNWITISNGYGGYGQVILQSVGTKSKSTTIKLITGGSDTNNGSSRSRVGEFRWESRI